LKYHSDKILKFYRCIALKILLEILIMKRKIFHFCRGAAFFYKNFALLL